MSVQRARHLRSVATGSERRLWLILRLFKHQGIHFRRQAPIGDYVVDFVCHRAKVIVELDGSQHGEPRNVRHDAKRTAFLESRGYRVLRVANTDLSSNRESIAEFILAEASARLRPPPDPLAR
jgi:very-short-patch-repair endonuclease